MIQQLNNYLNAAQAGSVDEYTALQKDAYFIERSSGVGSDYGSPPSAKKIGNVIAVELGDIDFMVSAHARGDSFGSALAGAQSKQKQLWTLIAQTCKNKGRGRTWTGWINQYSYGSKTTRSFRASRTWMLDWSFWCPDTSLESGQQESGNFIVFVYRNGALLSSGVNKLATSGYGDSGKFKKGRYHLHIISGCAWQVKAVPYY